MVYISKKYPSQQGEVKKGLAEAFSLSAQIAFIIQIVCFIIMCFTVDKASANLAIESFYYLLNSHLVLMLIQFLAFITVFVLCYFSKKVRNDLIAPTYLTALNGVYFVVCLIMVLVFIF